MKVDDSLVYPHFIPVPCLASFTTWCFAASDAQFFCWHADGSLNPQHLVFGASDQITTH